MVVSTPHFVFLLRNKIHKVFFILILEERKKSYQPHRGVTGLFSLSLAAGKLLMKALKGSGVLDEVMKRRGQGRVGDPQAADGGADGGNTQFGDRLVSPGLCCLFSSLRAGQRALCNSDDGRKTDGWNI